MTFGELSRERNNREGTRSLFESLPQIDWEQRRYEIAKDMMSSVVQRQDTRESARLNNMSFEKYSAMTAIYCADALIEELKK